MKTLATILLLAGAVGACNTEEPVSTTHTTGLRTMAPDNTKMDTRDNAARLTPMDQSNRPEDLEKTQAIRKAVMADDSLSNDAKNVTIITNNGVITLRGPVKDEAEKRNIETKAVAAAGGDRVDDQVDVQSK